MDASEYRLLEKIQRDLEVIKTSYDELKKEVERQRNVLYGSDGQPGIVTRLAVVENELKEIKSRLDDIDKSIRTLDKKISNNASKTMIYILTAITVFDGLLTVIVSLFH